MFYYNKIQLGQTKNAGGSCGAQHLTRLLTPRGRRIPQTVLALGVLKVLDREGYGWFADPSVDAFAHFCSLHLVTTTLKNSLQDRYFSEPLYFR